MEIIVLGIGSNLGDREQNIAGACNLLCKNLGNIVAKSAIIETNSWGFESENLFLNTVIVLNTGKTPLESLEICLQTEQRLGRVHSNSATYQSRIIDIDILFYGNEIINNKDLIVPHPLIICRDFVLTPLKEVIPDFIHPVLKRKISDLEFLYSI